MLLRGHDATQRDTTGPTYRYTYTARAHGTYAVVERRDGLTCVASASISGSVTDRADCIWLESQLAAVVGLGVVEAFRSAPASPRRPKRRLRRIVRRRAERHRAVFARKRRRSVRRRAPARRPRWAARRYVVFRASHGALRARRVHRVAVSVRAGPRSDDPPAPPEPPPSRGAS